MACTDGLQLPSNEETFLPPFSSLARSVCRIFFSFSWVTSKTRSINGSSGNTVGKRGKRKKQVGKVISVSSSTTLDRYHKVVLKSLAWLLPTLQVLPLSQGTAGRRGDAILFLLSWDPRLILSPLSLCLTLPISSLTGAAGVVWPCQHLHRCCWDCICLYQHVIPVPRRGDSCASPFLHPKPAR